MQEVEIARQIIAEVEKAVIGKTECVRMVLAAILAGGHVMIEDIPGVGKTTMALAFAKAMDLQQNRIQFTPDVLPSDITGFTMYHKETGSFRYHPGGVLCNLFLADEINRSPAKTQSALLEVMEEGTVTVDGVTHPVPRPFCVIATENPISFTGTQPLPESQLDRFMICVSMGYPEPEDELRILEAQTLERPVSGVQPVISRQTLLEAQQAVKNVYTHRRVCRYIVELAALTRNSPLLELGLSPRGSLALAAMSRAWAWLSGRDYVVPEDVQAVFRAVTRHRLRLSAYARSEGKRMEQVLDELLSSVKKPRPEVLHEE